MPNRPRPIKCLDNGVLYPSVQAAATALHIGRSSMYSPLARAIASSKNWFFCCGYEFEILPKPPYQSLKERRQVQYNWARAKYWKSKEKKS